MSEEETKAAWVHRMRTAAAELSSDMWEAAFEFGFNAGMDSMRQYRMEQGA